MKFSSVFSITPLVLVWGRNIKESEYFAYIAAGMLLSAAMLGYVIGAIAAMMGSSIYQKMTGREQTSYKRTLTVGGVLGSLIGMAVTGYFLFLK